MGAVIVVSGPGGVGKGTVVRRLVETRPDLVLSRSWTTREIRPGEDPDSYVFVTEDEFRAAIAAGRFLEHDHHFHAWYGSPVPEDPDVDLILEIDVNGARQIAQTRPDALFIFIDTPSRDTQRQRLMGRGDSAEQVERRMAGGDHERAVAADLPYMYVVNDDVDRAANEIGELIDSHDGSPDDEIVGGGEASC